MRHILSIILFTTLSLITFYVNAATPSIIYILGERETQVDWNIANNLQGTDPNIVSELTWKNIRSHQIGLGLNWDEGDYFLQAHGEYGLIYSGTNQDSDYNLDNRQGEYSRSINNAGKGHMLDTELNYGRHFVISPNFKTNLSIGYGTHNQSLRMYDGNQVIGAADLSGLDSSYRTSWKGPKINTELHYRMNKQVLSLGYSYHNVSFDGIADWNMRSDLEHPKSMSQDASGAGSKLSVKFERALSNISSLSFNLMRSDYAADGTHTFHNILSLDDVQRLNGVHWNSTEVQLMYRSLF